MADGMATLDAMIARLRAFGDGAGIRVAKAAVPGVLAAAKATAAAGTTPLGAPWKPKKDGGRPMANAADHITAAAHGPIVSITLTGPDVFHHKGLGGRPRRQVIPDVVSVGPGIWKALHAAAAAEFRRLAGGR